MSYTISIINDRTKDETNLKISDEQILALKNDLCGDDGIIDWIQDALVGKINNCIKRMKQKWTPILIDEQILPPKDNANFVSLITSREDYMDREQNEAEMKRLFEIQKAEQIEKAGNGNG